MGGDCTRSKSDSTTVTESMQTGYDAAGRAIRSWQARGAPGVWVLSGVATRLTYNSYGEVTAKALCDNLAGAGQVGGQGGIRTHGELSPTLVFKTSALNHSATCPNPEPERS